MDSVYQEFALLLMLSALVGAMPGLDDHVRYFRYRHTGQELA